MDWKEFFRLTDRKLQIILIGVPINIFLFMMLIGCAWGDGFVCQYIIFPAIYLLMTPSLLVTIIADSFEPQNTAFALFSYIIMEILYLYLLSCIIIFIYNKFKKKN